MHSEVSAPEEGNPFLRPARPPEVEAPSPDLSSLTGGVYAVLGHRFTVWASDPHGATHRSMPGEHPADQIEVEHRPV